MRIFRRIDDLLNNITMYRLMVYVLSLLLGIAFIFMLTGILSYSAVGFMVTTGVLLVACFVANQGLARLFKVTPNHESGIITTLILACLLPQVSKLSDALLVAATGVLAIAVKYVLVWRGSHFLNPAATGAAVMSTLGLVPVIWWIANPPMFVPMLLLGLLVLRKVRRFTLFGWFVLAATVVMLLVSLLHGFPAWPALKTLALSYPLLFLGMIMLTEPTTLPAGRYNMMLYGLLVGSLFGSQLDLGPVSMSPHVALVLGNVFSLIVSPKRGLRLKLTSRTELAPHIYDLTFDLTPGARVPYAAGQYMEWTLPGVKFDSRGNRRTFTVASSPTESDLRIGIKTYEPSSAFKRRLLELTPGDVVLAGHIGGSFTLPADTSQKLLWIAGGIGVTPFRSMTKQLLDTGQRRDVVLIYSARPEEFVYKDIFEAAAAAINLKEGL
jgi:hypothetical protein